MTIPGGFVAGDILGAADMNLLPAGKMGYASVTAAQATITSVTDLTSLTVTFTAVTGRLYKTTVSLALSTTAASQTAAVYIRNGSSTILQRREFFMGDADDSGEVINHSAHVEHLSTGSGSTTHKVSLELLEGAGSCGLRAAATYPAFIVVEDIGPS